MADVGPNVLCAAGLIFRKLLGANMAPCTAGFRERENGRSCYGIFRGARVADRRDAYWYQQGNEQRPEPGRNNRRLLGMAIGFVSVCVIAACVAAGYYLWTSLAPPEPAGGPIIPTPPGGPEVSTATVSTPAAVATVTLPPGTATPWSPTTPATAVAASVSEPPGIDGDLEEWAAVPSTTSAFRVFRAAGWDGTEDLTAVWRLAWDADYLYVAVDVEDDVHVQTETGNQIFRGDSVELQIDTEPAVNAANVNAETFQIILSPGNFSGLPPSAFRFQGTSGGRLVDAPGHSIRVAAQRTAGGYQLEAAIPWRDVDVTPAAGMELGLALNANDNDTPGTAVQEVMMSSARGRTLTDPRTWGTLRLQ